MLRPPRKPASSAPKAAAETEPTRGKCERPRDLFRDCAKVDRAQCNGELFCDSQLNYHSAHSNIRSDPVQERAGLFVVGFFSWLFFGALCSLFL